MPTENTITVVFNSQKWVQINGEERAVDYDGKEPVEYHVPVQDATDKNGNFFPDDSYL